MIIDNRKNMLKVDSADFPLISFITIVFNDKKNLEITIKSVLNLSYSNIEFIIIDGASSDGTLEIIYKYNTAIDYIISEKDKGPYDAMNKGIKLAKGRWINFLNAGDRIYFLDELSLRNNKSTFTNYYYDEEKKRVLRRPLTKLYLTRNMPCHQSIIYHKSEIIEFSLDYPVIADYVQILEILNDIAEENIFGNSFFHYNIPGISAAYASSNGLEKIRQLYKRNLIIKDKIGVMFFFIAILNSVRILITEKIKKMRRS